LNQSTPVRGRSMGRPSAEECPHDRGHGSLKGRSTDVVCFSTSEVFSPVDFPANFKLLVTPTFGRHVPILIAMCG
jgi:hypothetical protein